MDFSQKRNCMKILQAVNSKFKQRLKSPPFVGDLRSYLYVHDLSLYEVPSCCKYMLMASPHVDTSLYTK